MARELKHDPGGRLFVRIVGGPPVKGAGDPQTELLRFLRRFFIRAYMLFSLAYVAIAATVAPVYWVPAIGIVVIGLGRPPCCSSAFASAERVARSSNFDGPTRTDQRKFGIT
jgi:hypothetical protein